MVSQAIITQYYILSSCFHGFPQLHLEGFVVAIKCKRGYGYAYDTINSVTLFETFQV